MRSMALLGIQATLIVGVLSIGAGILLLRGASKLVD